MAQRFLVIDEEDDAFIHGNASPPAHNDAIATP
jgi:hypothetical protein